MPAPYRRLGRILKAHGTQGEVLVAPRDDLSFPRAGSDEDVWVVPPPLSGAAPRRVLEVRSAAKGLLVRLSRSDTAADAHELAGRWLLAEGEELPPAADVIEKLIGYSVRDAKHGLLGEVTDVIVTGANDVLVVDDGPFGQVLIPVIDDVMRDADDDARELRVELLPGLLEDAE